jgi:hypothetical protein
MQPKGIVATAETCNRYPKSPDDLIADLDQALAKI